MFSHFSIGRKISLGFTVIILSTIVAFYITNTTFVNSQKINEEITTNHTPSIAKLEELKLLIVRSKMLINNWVYLESPAENEDKVALNRLTVSEYPKLRIEIETLAKNWEDSTKTTSLDPIFDKVEELWSNHDIIKRTLSGVESYRDPFNLFTARSMVEEGGEIYVYTDEILTELNILIDQKKNTTEIITAEMIDSFQGVRMLIKNLGIGLTIAGILIAFLTTRTIVSPVRKLRLILLDLSKGIFPKSWVKSRGD
jgi:hypothetical protein